MHPVQKRGRPVPKQRSGQAERLSQLEQTNQLTPTELDTIRDSRIASQAARAGQVDCGYGREVQLGVEGTVRSVRCEID
jgi:hypothetical protein